MASVTVGGSTHRSPIPCFPAPSAAPWLPPTQALTKTQKDRCNQLAQKTAGKIECNLLLRSVAALVAALGVVLEFQPRSLWLPRLMK